MNGEFDEHRPSGDSQHLATDVDDAPPEFQTLIERAATPDLDEHHRDRLQPVRAKVEQVVLAKLRNPHIGAPKLEKRLRVPVASLDPTAMVFGVAAGNATDGRPVLPVEATAIAPASCA